MAEIGKGDMHHSIIRSFDEASESLKTTITNAAVDITVSAFTDSIAIADNSGNKVTTTNVGAKQALDVNVADITLDKSNDSVSTLKIDESTRIDAYDANTTYLGFANVGSSESSSVWKIKRILASGSITSTTYADGDALYNNIWSNRASLSYS